MALNLPYGIRPVVAQANIDERYGPHASKTLALIATSGTRKVGLTIGILENGEAVEYWFKSGISDADLIPKLPTTEIIDTSTAEVWSELLPYEAGNIYVSFVNIESTETIFQSEALYRCQLATTAGISPEDSLYDAILNPTGNWVYQGTQVVVSTSSTSTSVVQNISTLTSIIGYKSGHTVSVIDEKWTYKFDSLNESGYRPNDGGSGSWLQFVRFTPGHIIKDNLTTFDNKINLKFLGNVKVQDTIDSTIINIGWNIININSNTTVSFTAQPNTIYIVDGTAASVLAILPNSISGNTDQFRFILKSDPHKLTITTAGGVQLIEGYTSQNIPTVAGSLLLISNGTGYNIIEDTRQLINIVEVTTNRDFSTDGFENNVIYYIKPNGAEVTITLPPPSILPGNTPIKARFEQSGIGRSVIHATDSTIGGAIDQIITSDSQGFDIIWVNGNYLIQVDTRPKILTTSYTSYPTKVDSTIIDPLTSTYFKKRVSTVEDPAFDVVTQTFSNFTLTANPTDPYQLLTSSSITSVGALIGTVPEGSLTIYWNMYKTTSTNINVYAKYFKRNSVGVETLIATSAIGYVDSINERQYILSTTHSEFIMTSEDTIVVRYYARKNTTGTNPVLYLGVEGPNPTKSIFEVAVGSITHNQIPGRNLENAHLATSIQLSTGESVEVKLAKLYTESATTPLSPNKGDKWLDTTTGILYDWFSNTDGLGAWVCWTKI